MTYRAAWQEQLGDGMVRCLLCPHRCLLKNGQRGICLTRRNHQGMLTSDNYCRPVSQALDPIEKKPLYHFFPGKMIYSTGPNGCNLKCRFCQNCDISQQLVTANKTDADDIANAAARDDSIGIAYTYSEPYIWFETILEVAAKTRAAGLKNVMVTNGFMERGPLDQLLEYVDAMNIDIKSMDESFYRRLCKARLAPVLESCKRVREAGCHLEITCLVIPGENSAPAQIEQLARWIAVNLGKDTPLHLSRYFPRYRMTSEATSTDDLFRACRQASEFLDFVYAGNVLDDSFADTRCPGCHTVLISRTGYTTTLHSCLKTKNNGNGYCTQCGTKINTVM